MNIFDRGETSFSTGQYGISTSMYGKTQTIQPPLVYWWINPYFDALAPITNHSNDPTKGAGRRQKLSAAVAMVWLYLEGSNME